MSGQAPIYTPADLEQILTTIEPAMRRAGQLKPRRLRYWLLNTYRPGSGKDWKPWY